MFSVLLQLINQILVKYVEHNKSDLNMTAYCVKMLKQLEYLFKLIVRSRVLYAKYVRMLKFSHSRKNEVLMNLDGKTMPIKVNSINWSRMFSVHLLAC